MDSLASRPQLKSPAHSVASTSTTPDGSSTTSSPAIPTQAKGTKTSASLERLRTDNRELLKYKAAFNQIAEEKSQEEQAEKSAQNKQVLDKYAAKQAKGKTVKKKTSKKPAEVIAAASDSIWEFVPDPSKPCTEVVKDNEDGEYDDGDVMAGVLNHKKKVGGPPEVLIVFESGETYWTAVENAFKDGRLIVSAYITDNNLLGSVFEPKQMKKKNKSATVVQANQKNCSQKEMPEVEQMKCSHDDYRTEIGGYKSEVDCRYFMPTLALGNCCCALCEKKFVPVATTTVEEVRPSSSKPAYMCVNRLHGCTHGVCYDCFIIKGESTPSGLNSRCCSTRGSTNNN